MISANGIAGVEVFGTNASDNLIFGNTIGTGSGGQLFSASGPPVLSSNGPEPGIPVYEEAQRNGVVILGSSRNTIGLDRRIGGSEGNTISGNVQVGVYITSRDFQGNGYTAPIDNAVSGNTIREDGDYGVLLYDAPKNAVPPYTGRAPSLKVNHFGSEAIPFRNYQKSFDGATPIPVHGHNTGRQPSGAHVRHVRLRHPIRARVHPGGPLHAFRRVETHARTAIFPSPFQPGPIAMGTIGETSHKPTAGGGVNGVVRRVRP